MSNDGLATDPRAGRRAAPSRPAIPSGDSPAYSPDEGLRVLHLLDHSIPLHSGYTFRTLSILREQRRLGWQTFHLTSPKQVDCTVDEEDVDGWHFFRTPTHEQPLPRLPGLHERALMRRFEQRLEQVVREVRPHLLHAHSPVLNALPALKVGRRLGVPVVYEVRAFWEDAAVDHGTTREGSLRYRATRWLETRALRGADHVFTICEGLRSDIVGRGIAADKVTVIPNAVDIESFGTAGAADPALRQRLGLNDCAVVGFIGSFYAYEGLDLLLDALPLMLKVLPDVRLLLVGGGPQEQALKAQAQRLGIADKVVFTGRVPHAEVQRYYDLIDVLAYPRHSMRLTELVTPLKPLEAMAQGRLLVASDVGGHKELVRHGETGLLFQAGNAEALKDTLLRVLAKKDMWPQLKQAGRSFVEQERNWRASVGRYRDAYRGVVLQGAG
jgi:PEP-CTERM/exosortase A-associated glycosyltransferase